MSMDIKTMSKQHFNDVPKDGSTVSYTDLASPVSTKLLLSGASAQTPTRFSVRTINGSQH